MATKKLFEKLGTIFKEFSPSVSIDSIIEQSSDKTLKTILYSYNHVYVEWKGTVALTRAAVPLYIRRHGLYVTYDDGDGIITDCFTGEDSKTNTEDFVKDNNWKTIVYNIATSGTTEQRPDNNTKIIPIGFQYFDVSLGFPIYWNGSVWVNYESTPV